MLNSAKQRKQSTEKINKDNIEGFEKKQKKIDKELKFILNRVKIQNINEAVQEVIHNAKGKEEIKYNLVENQESILHNEILKHNLTRIDSAKLLKNKKLNLIINNKMIYIDKNYSSYNNNLSSNNYDNLQKSSSVSNMTKNSQNTHKNFNYVFNKYNKDKFLNKIYSPPLLNKKKSESKISKENKNCDVNKKYYFSNKHASKEGCKFRFFSKKYSSSSEKKNENLKIEANSNNQKLKSDILHPQDNKIIYKNPLVKSVPFSLCKTEETFYKRNNPEYIKIKPNSSFSSHNFTKNKSHEKADINSNRKQPIHERLYEMHTVLKNKHQRLTREMTPSFAPKLYKPLKRVSYEKCFI